MVVEIIVNFFINEKFSSLHSKAIKVGGGRQMSFYGAWTGWVDFVVVVVDVGCEENNVKIYFEREREAK